MKYLYEFVCSLTQTTVIIVSINGEEIAVDKETFNNYSKTQ